MSFDDLVLESIAALQPNAYGVTIQERLEIEYRRYPSIGSVYTAIDRLEAESLITTKYEPRHGSKRQRRMCLLTDGGGRRLRGIMDGLDNAAVSRVI